MQDIIKQVWFVSKTAGKLWALAAMQRQENVTIFILI